VFTVASGDPAADGVAVGDFASVYADGSMTTGFVGRVTARTTTTITVSLSVVMGTPPSTGTGDRTLKIGGAWQGPTGATSWPIGTTIAGLTNVAGNPPRVNLKNDATYSISTGLTIATNGRRRYQGYTTSYGDGGRATIDGSTNAIVLVAISAVFVQFMDFILSNNGTSGTNAGLSISASRVLVQNVVAHDIRGSGLTTTSDTAFIECEAYACNGSNSSALGGIVGAMTGTAIRCISHDNSGGNGNGFVNLGVMNGCIGESNAGAGVLVSAGGNTLKNACDFYNNSGSGINISNSGAGLQIISCNFVKNGAYGIAVASGGVQLVTTNCGFGAGTQANTSGNIQSQATSLESESGNVNYASDVTPWVDPANGDFRINLAAAKGAGRGTFTQTASSYAGTVGYPDIGAAQHQDSGGGGGIPIARGMHGGMR
jgi:hypothetical protein